MTCQRRTRLRRRVAGALPPPAGLMAVTALMAVAALAGCASNPPMHYYTLNDIPPATPPLALHGTGVPPPTRLGPVSLPPELDRQQLVTHSSVNQVQVHELNRWAAPLDEQIRRTLSDDLAARVPATGSVSSGSVSLIVDPDAPSGKNPRRTLTISLSRLDIDAQCAVSLRASWTLQGGGDARPGAARIDQPAAGGDACPAAAAATISQALAVLADRLAPFVMQNTPPAP